MKLSGLAVRNFCAPSSWERSCRQGPAPTMPTCFTRRRAFATMPTSLAKVANTYGEASRQSVEEMTSIARAVWKEVKENW